MVNIEIKKCRCEYLVNPLGLDVHNPRLSWILESDLRGQKQTAYHILVASQESLLKENIGDLWDTGRMESDKSNQIVYQGKPLESRMRCYWKVKVWDKDGQPSAWNQPAFWTMGLLRQTDWKAQWIGRKRNLDLYKTSFRGKELFLPPSSFLRKEFNLEQSPARAVLYITALGLFEMHINGDKVGNDCFTPGWTDYKKRLYYFTYDVTEQLAEGTNSLAAILADGWYAGYVGFALDQNLPNPRNQYGDTPALCCQLEVDYANGNREIITTNPSWKSSLGPILDADMFMGESYDARLDMPDWDKPGFTESDWEPVDLIETTVGYLQAYPGVKVQQTAEITPVSITEPKKGVIIFDMGQNFAGRAKLKVKGEKGNKIVLRFGEMLHPDGRLMTENLRYARATDTYILRGDDSYEIWEPRFTYHGFQYVEVTGLSEKPEKDTVTGIVLHTDTPQAGSFECSNEMINKLYSNIIWTQRSNFFEVPTDCPQRDERCGWSGDAQIYVRSATYNADVAAFFTKWLVDLEDAQRQDGAFTDYAPFSFVFKQEQASGWADAGIIIPYVLYKTYGDTQFIRRHFQAMKKFMAYQEDNSIGFLRKANTNDWGDWLAIGKQTSLDFLASAFYAYDARLIAEMAEVIGEKKDAHVFRDLYENIKIAFCEKYVSEDRHISEDTQTSYALALYFDLLPQHLQKKAAGYLVNLIHENDGNLATGFLGVKHLLPALTIHGYVDVAYDLLLNTSYPSWGYSVINGATTIWERWNSYAIDEGFNKDGMNSFSHYAFGSVCEWMFSTMAGIDSEDAGFKEIIIKPQIGGDITYVKSHYDSINGRIESHWHAEEKSLKMKVKIPANTTALVYLPARNHESVTERSKPVAESQGITFLRMENSMAVFRIESGEYSFNSRK